MIECMKKIARKQNMVGDEKVTVCMSSNEREMCKKSRYFCRRWLRRDRSTHSC